MIHIKDDPKHKSSPNVGIKKYMVNKYTGNKWAINRYLVRMDDEYFELFI